MDYKDSMKKIYGVDISDEVLNLSIKYCDVFKPEKDYLSKKDRLNFEDEIMNLDARILGNELINIPYKDRGIVEYFIESMLYSEFAYKIKIRITKEENINVKKEQKTMQKMMKRKFKKEIKKQNSKPDEKISNMSRKKKMRNEIIISWMALIALLFRIGWIQFGMGSELQAKAYVQQTLDRSINPRRGTIYDSTETTILAVSSTVETVTVNPVNIKKEDKEKESQLQYLDC